MTPDPLALARLYAACFPDSRPWSVEEFAEFLTDPKTVFSGDETAFALGRCVLDEAELLTLVVAPSARRQGAGRTNLQAFETLATARGAQTAFLEVAADNAAAIALYQTAGYRESGRRKGYYARTSGPKVDAVTMLKLLKRT